jgi:hypothetical protein
VRFSALVSVRSSSRIRTPRLAATLALATLPVLVGCGASFNARTNIPYQPAQGITDRSGDVYLVDTLVVTDEEGNGTVVARLVNEQADPDELESITAVDSTGKQITAEPLSEPVALGVPPEPNQSVQVGYDGLLRLTGDNLVAGEFVTITFTFGSAAPVTVEVPVLPVGSLYGDIPVGPAATTTDGTPTG